VTGWVAAGSGCRQPSFAVDDGQSSLALMRGDALFVVWPTVRVTPQISVRNDEACYRLRQRQDLFVEIIAMFSGNLGCFDQPQLCIAQVSAETI
jgi:hypothetical protein